jgi:hypothetical protein
MQSEQDRKYKLKLADIQFSQELYKSRLKRDMENWDANSKDPTVRKIWIQKWVEQLMAQYDWLIQSSRDMLVDRIESDIKAGKTYGESLAWIMNEIKNKPEYKMYMSTKAWFDYTPKSMWGGLLWLPDGKWGGKVVTEDSYKQTQTPWYSSQISQAIQQERAMSGMSQYDNYDFAQQILSWQITTRTGTVCLPGMTWGQCGAFVNDMMWVAWFMGNTIESKINRTKDPQRYSPVPVVLTIDYVDSNGKAWKEKIWVNKSIKVWNNMYFTRAKDKQTPSVSTTGTASIINLNNQLLSTKWSKILPAWETTSLAQWLNLPQQISNLKSIIDSNKSLFWPVVWRIWEINPYNTDVQTINAKLKTASQMVGKFMEWWVLRKEDEEKYRKMLPSITDTPEVASNKVDNVVKSLQEAYNWYLDSYAKWWYDVSKYSYINMQPTQQSVQQPSNLSTMFWTVW